LKSPTHKQRIAYPLRRNLYYTHNLASTYLSPMHEGQGMRAESTVNS
jgi:hypothetical protein